MKRLLIFHKTIAPYRIDFFNDLSSAFDTEVVLDYRNLISQKFDYKKIQNEMAYTPFYLDKAFSIGKRTFYKGYSKHIEKYNPDIILANEYGLNLWIAIAKNIFRKKKYKIVSICDDSVRIADTCDGIRKIARNLSLKFIDGLILCNSDVEEWYRKKFKIKTYVFPIIHKEDRIRKKLQEAKALSESYIKKYGLEGCKVFGFVGRLAPEKNINYLVTSFIRACKDHENIRLLIIGGDSSEDQHNKHAIENIIKDSGNKQIILCGRHEEEELYALYNCIQALVLPSVYEPFGAVTGEALTAGSYVMVSNRAGSACLTNEENGEIIDINKPHIDFEPMIKRLTELKLPVIINNSKLSVSYATLMGEMIEWLNTL